MVIQIDGVAKEMNHIVSRLEENIKIDHISNYFVTGDMEETGKLIIDVSSDWLESQREPNLIKVNLPDTEEKYKDGDGEGCFFIVDDKTKAAYDECKENGTYSGILANDSMYYPGLMYGQVLEFEMRGENRPVVPFDLLARYK